MKESTKLRIFAILLIAGISLTGYMIKDKLPKEDDILIYSHYRLLH